MGNRPSKPIFLYKESLYANMPKICPKILHRLSNSLSHIPFGEKENSESSLLHLSIQPCDIDIEKNIIQTFYTKISMCFLALPSLRILIAVSWLRNYLFL